MQRAIPHAGIAPPMCDDDPMMRIVTILSALFVFAALLVVDTGAILGLIFSWATGGPAYRWILLCAPFAIVALYVWGQKHRQKRRRTMGRNGAGPARVKRRASANHPQNAKSNDRRKKAIASRGKR
jgi:hypothetical protein